MSDFETKAIEIRDEATCIPALAIRMYSEDPVQRYYLKRCGFPDDGSSIMLMKIYDGKATNDPYSWEGGSRTMPVAHNWIIDHFAELKDGDVVDVEFVLGEKAHAKISERLAGVR